MNAPPSTLYQVRGHRLVCALAIPLALAAAPRAYQASPIEAFSKAALAETAGANGTTPNVESIGAANISANHDAANHNAANNNVAANSIAAGDDAETVVLLHGLGRSSMSMWPLALRLRKAGFEVHNVDYPSTRKAPDALVELIAAELDACCAETNRVHFVTHSLGGILVRAYVERFRPSNLGRVVMLAPPNGGSELVDLLGDFSAFRWAMGPTAPLLGTDDQSLPRTLPDADFELGVIAGTGTVNPVGSLLLPGPSDGTVTLASTKLAGMDDHLVVPNSHTFIALSSDVARQTEHFIRHGRFDGTQSVAADTANNSAAKMGDSPSRDH